MGLVTVGTPQALPPLVCASQIPTADAPKTHHLHSKILSADGLMGYAGALVDAWVPAKAGYEPPKVQCAAILKYMCLKSGGVASLFDDKFNVPVLSRFCMEG